MRQKPGISDPLDTRAWVFQEKRLAHRLLNFTSEEVQWSCKVTFSCKCPKAWKNVSNIWLKTSLHLVPATTEEWKEAVMDFSGLNLTYQSDKLPALSGLATRFQQKHNVNYLAGLWLNDQIIEQLVWCQNGSQTDQDDEHDLAYRAPTFSWASTNAKVFWFLPGQTDSYIDILETQCTLATENPFGEVCNGYLRVRGRVIGLTLCQPSEREAQPSLHSADGQDLGLPLYLDKDARQNYFLKVAKLSGSKSHPGRSLRWLTGATGDLPKSISVLCLRICVYGLYKVNQFLVLVESPLRPGAYERIGQVCIGGLLTMNGKQEQARKIL